MSNKATGNKNNMKSQCLPVHFHKNTKKYRKLPHKTEPLRLMAAEKSGSTVKILSIMCTFFGYELL